MEIEKVIKERRSTRGFTAEKISDEAIDKIVESAFYAPLAVNTVSWHLTVLKNEAMIDRLAGEIKEFLSVDPAEHVKRRLAMDGFSPFYQAKTVIVMTVDEENKYSHENAGASIQNMLLTAKDMGIDSIWVGMGNAYLKTEKGKKFLKDIGAPEEYEIIACLGFGYSNYEIPMPDKHLGEYDKIVNVID